MPDIGDIHAFELGDGRWGCLQLTRVEKKSVAAEVLDWVGSAAPSLDELGTVGPMVFQRLRSDGRPRHDSVDRGSVPGHFPFVGNRPRGEGEEPSSTVVWGGFPHGVLLELRWRAASQGAREHFLTCASNREARVEVDGIGEVPVRARRVELDLRGRDAPYDWSQLDRLGALLILAVTGPAAGLREYLSGRELVRHLVWREPGPGDLDLAASGLEELDLELGDEVARTVRVGPELDQLRLRPEDAAHLRFQHPTQGRGVTLRVEACSEEHPGVLPGLEELSGLVLARPTRLAAEQLAGYTALRALWARLEAGVVEDAGAMAAWGALRTLQLDDAYEMDPADFPGHDAWPELDEVRLDGLRKEDAAALKKKWKGVPSLEVRNAKDAAWVRAHLTSPFRNWDEEVGKRAGAAACKAYEKAAKAAAKKGAKAEPVLATFVDTFEKIHAKTPLDTDQREQIGDVFHDLAAALGVSKAQATRWFSAWRSF